MPTGYTAAIEEGIEFRDFVLRCARNFGALIEMRDDPMDAKIPDEFKPSDYHAKELAKARADFERLDHMLPSTAEREAEREHAAAVKDWARSEGKTDDLRAKYEAMLRQVEAWSPPSADHRGLKDFMREQIQGSIKFDCASSQPPLRLSGEDWRMKRLSAAKWSIDYHTKAHAEEVERCASRNLWVQQLRDALDDPRAAPKGKR